MSRKNYYELAKEDGRLSVYRENRKKKLAALRERLADGTATPEEVQQHSESVARRKSSERQRRERIASGTPTEADLLWDEKRKLARSEWLRENAEYIAEKNREWRAANKDSLRISKRQWMRDNYPSLWERKKEWIQKHPEEHKKRRQNGKDRLMQSPEKFLLSRLRGRVPGVALEPEDLLMPEVCPLLGIPLKINSGQRGASKDSPSIDRIDNTKGYVRGNVWVISHRANTMKNCSSREELKTFCINALALMENGVLAAIPEERDNGG